MKKQHPAGCSCGNPDCPQFMATQGVVVNATPYTITECGDGRWDVREDFGGIDDPRVIATKATREEAQATADRYNANPRRDSDVG